MVERSDMNRVDARDFVMPEERKGLSFKVPVPFGATGAFVAVCEALLIVVLAVVNDKIYALVTGSQPSSESSPIAAGVMGAILFCLLMHARRHYQPSNVLNRTRAASALQIWLIVVASVLALGFFARASGEYSRGAAVCFFASCAVILPASSIFARRSLTYLIANGLLEGRRRVVTFGETAYMTSYGVSERLKMFGYRVVGHFGMMPSDLTSIDVAIRRLINFARNNQVDEVFLALDGIDHRSIQAIAQRLQELPIPVRLLFDRDLDELLSFPMSDLGAAKSVKLQGGPLSPPAQFLKRAFDVTVASLALIMLAPILLLVAVAIRIDSPGPVIFRQHRAGFGGRIFQIYKFRSMRCMDDGDTVRQATRNDQRVTRIGGYIRRTSIDELPQLLNVLRGEMSIVGPRPHALSHDDQYTRAISTYALRHHMKPGITGWAQVNGCRGETPALADMEMRIHYDIWYIKHWNMLLDFRAVGKTVWALCNPKNVY